MLRAAREGEGRGGGERAPGAGSGAGLQQEEVLATPTQQYPFKVTLVPC